MKGRRAALVGAFSIATLVVSGAYADKPDKPGKPDTPGAPKTECITFMGDLVGDWEVEGCCLNRGPWPAYRMTLSGGLPLFLHGTYDGHLFVGPAGVGRYPPYMVQFWDDDRIAIEIVGGVVDDDRKSKVLTVTYNNATCTDLETGDFVAYVTFTLVRTPDLTGCPVLE